MASKRYTKSSTEKTKTQGSAYDKIFEILATGDDSASFREVDGELGWQVVERVTDRGDAVMFYRGRKGEYLGIIVFEGDVKNKKTCHTAEEMDELLGKLVRLCDGTA